MKNLRLYNVLREPHISEKVSILGEEANQYAFKVAIEATRPQIKEAVEEIFKVAVKKVTTSNVKGKVKRNAQGLVKKKNWKKAYVTLERGEELDYLDVK
jgi:large subunit ribosomal protein L23